MRGMKKQERCVRQALESHPDDVPRPRKAGPGVPDEPLRLQSCFPKPVVREGEPSAAVVVLLILQAHRTAVPEHGAGQADAVRHAGQELRQVESRVRVVSHPYEKHPTV